MNRSQILKFLYSAKFQFFIQKIISFNDFLQYFDLLKALAGHLEIDNRSIFEPHFIFFVNEVKNKNIFRGSFDYVENCC